MADAQKEKYQRLMAEIQKIESGIEALETRQRPGDKLDEKIIALQTQLAAKRNELARISDGCGTPHTR